MSDTRLRTRGHFVLWCRSPQGKLQWKVGFHNGVTTAGCNGVLNAGFNAGTPSATWYVGLISNASYTGVASGDTHAAHAGWTEWTTYSGSNRPTWLPGPATGGVLSTPVPFTWSITGAGAIRGAFLANVAAVGSVSPSGLLYCTAVMASGKAVNPGDTIHGTYILTIGN